jgi:hypothetical protein
MYRCSLHWHHHWSVLSSDSALHPGDLCTTPCLCCGLRDVGLVLKVVGLLPISIIVCFHRIPHVLVKAAAKRIMSGKPKLNANWGISLKNAIMCRWVSYTRLGGIQQKSEKIWYLDRLAKFCILASLLKKTQKPEPVEHSGEQLYSWHLGGWGRRITSLRPIWATQQDCLKKQTKKPKTKPK